MVVIDVAASSSAREAVAYAVVVGSIARCHGSTRPLERTTPHGLAATIAAVTSKATQVRITKKETLIGGIAHARTCHYYTPEFSRLATPRRTFKSSSALKSTERTVYNALSCPDNSGRQQRVRMPRLYFCGTHASRSAQDIHKM